MIQAARGLCLVDYVEGNSFQFLLLTNVDIAHDAVYLFRYLADHPATAYGIVFLALAIVLIFLYGFRLFEGMAQCSHEADWLLFV